MASGSVADVRWIEKHFHGISPSEFDSCWRSVESFQREHSPVYRKFGAYTFLPIDAFKFAAITCFPPEQAEALFLSSGTSNRSVQSRHYVKSLDMYRRSVVTHFTRRFGTGPFSFLCCVPVARPDRGESSLRVMCQILMNNLGSEQSSFFDPHPESFASVLEKASLHPAPLVVFGLAFALLDLLDLQLFPLPDNATVIETGGMKTKRREIDRESLYITLRDGFSVTKESVVSEYGMCELMSQFYSSEDGLFYPPPWVQFAIHNPMEPEREVPDGEPGALAIIDLANLYSVSAILTQDSAIQRGSGFDLLGRLSGAELRGCNFLLESIT